VNQQTHNRFEDEGENRSGAWLLGHGIRNILRCDEAEVVSGIAAYVMTQHRVLGRGAELMARMRQTPLPSIAALLGFMTRFLEVHECKQRADVVWVARLDNERRAIEKVVAALPNLNWTEVKLFRPPDPAGLRALISLFRLGPRRIMSVARRLHRKHEFFKVLRALELVGYYARYLSLFREGHYALAVMSSHSNPHGIAFDLAARRCGLPVVLITHGMPVRPVARLQYDLAAVHCEAARRTYLDEGCDLGTVFLHGRKHHHRQMITALPDHISLGIFLCKDVNEETLQRLVAQLLINPRISRVLLRPHPKNLWRGLDAWVESRNDPRLGRSLGGPILEDLETVDFVLAGNSSVLIDVVISGRPAAYLPRLDYGAHDMHRLVQSGLICSIWEKGSGREFDFDPEDMLRFYQRPEWSAVLRLFANIDEDEATVLTRVAAEMRQLATSRV
jgi:hypothetical protein